MATVRSYVLAPVKRVSDPRTGHEEADPQAVLDGDIDDFLDDAIRARAYLRRKGQGGKGGALRGRTES
jgi:peptide chain release factor 2